ncbi:MAG: IS630 family transposase, partial [Caldilinea sp.]
LDQRIGQKETLSNEVIAWETRRNQRAAATNWQFTTQDARVKLKHLYPSLDA